MSVPITEYWFSPHIRRNRQSFILASLLLWCILPTVLFGLYALGATYRAGIFVLAVFFLPVCICSWCLTIQRLHDMGVTGWLSLLWIPASIADRHTEGAATLACVIILIGVPGSKGKNSYGRNQLEEGRFDE